IWGSGVRISSGAPLRNRTGHAKTRRFAREVAARPASFGHAEAATSVPAIDRQRANANAGLFEHHDRAPDNAGSKGDKFANSSASCRAGVQLVAPRNRRSDGAASRVSAN